MILKRYWLLMGLGVAVCAACGGPVEATRVTMPVLVDSGGIEPVTTDLGYTVELTAARMAVQDFGFTIAGEVHTAFLPSIGRLLVGTAYAHPGHYQGGDLTGEMNGRFIIDWVNDDATPIANATLLEGDYDAVNFTFGFGAEEDGLSAQDPLQGHTAFIEGTARRDGQTVSFTAVVDAPVGRLLVGAPFETEVRATATDAIGYQLLTQDPFEDDTLFDGLDFFTLDIDGDGQLALDATNSAVEDGYNQLRRMLLSHDHYRLVRRQP